MVNLPGIRSLVVFVLFICLPSGVALPVTAQERVPADYLSATDLARNCRLTAGGGYLHCIGYLGGAIDVHRRTAQLNPEAARFCAPQMKVEDRRKLFLDWVNANASLARTISAAEAVERALAAKFPCTK